MPNVNADGQWIKARIQKLKNQIIALEMALEAMDEPNEPVLNIVRRPEPLPQYVPQPTFRNPGGPRRRNHVDRGILRARLYEVMRPGEKLGPMEFGKRVRKLGMHYINVNSQLKRLRDEGLIVAEGTVGHYIYMLAPQPQSLPQQEVR